MADISGYLTNIKNAARGEDVRDSIINALKKINQDNPATVLPLNVTANGTYSGQGGIVYNPVTVNVPEGASQALSLSSIKIVENGEYTPDDGEAYSKIIVEVPQIGLDLMTDPKVIYLEEGAKSYYALDDGYDGYTQVDVVSGGGGGSAATYTVNFYASDRTTILETVVGVPFGGGAVYHRSQPTSSGMRFVGWSPNPMNVKSNMDCYPRFENLTYDDTQILDDWVTIAKNIQTNPDYYNIGQWKLLEFERLPYENISMEARAYFNADPGFAGSGFLYGRTKMVLVGKGVDELEGSNGYANTSWLSYSPFVLMGYNAGNNRVYNASLRHKANNDFTHPNSWVETPVRNFYQGLFTTNMFPKELLPYVKRVIKRTSTYGTTVGGIFDRDYPTIEWFFTPSAREMIGNVQDYDASSAPIEQTGPIYMQQYTTVAEFSEYWRNRFIEYYNEYIQYDSGNNIPDYKLPMRTAHTGGLVYYGNAVYMIYSTGSWTNPNPATITAADDRDPFSDLLGFCL